MADRPRMTAAQLADKLLADEHVQAFRTRPLEGRYPYLFLDAKVEKVRDGGRVVNKALVIAHGVHESGRREILSIDVGEAETEAFWTDFLRGLVKRGLVGVQLAISWSVNGAGSRPRLSAQRLLDPGDTPCDRCRTRLWAA